MNINKKIHKIINYKTYSNRNKIELLLRIIDDDINCNLDLDSTNIEFENAKKKRKLIYKAIKKIDFNTGERFLKLMDV
tara:strand:+ start:81 stop:314 length:234 start_codon:yes stop_codon:yes gene_type:complete